VAGSSKPRATWLRWPQPSIRATVAIVATVGFALALLRGTASRFFFDAQMYWLGADAAISGNDFYTAGGLGIRGALSAFVYIPAALVTQLVGEDFEAASVLVQNSLLIALVGAVLIPAIASYHVRLRPVHIWVSMLGTFVMLGGFAPYPLMDVWATASVLAGIFLLARRQWWSVLLGGIALGVAVNLRPAHLVPVALLLVVWAVYRWRSALFALVGAAAAFLPQVIVNKDFVGDPSPFPVQTFLITDIQSQYASFTVRYDTVPYGGTDPRLFFCSPDYAEAVVGNIPGSSGELAGSYAGHLGSALVFMAQKVAAALHWSFSTPYSEPPGAFSALTPIVVIVSAVGILALVRAAIRSRRARWSPVLPMLFALWLGCLSTLAVSAPEARFALPVVLVGLVGILVVLPTRRLDLAGIRDRAVWPWVLGAVCLSVALVLVGLSGLSHPAPPGDVDAAICSVE
jgi:hypothetical protein